MGRLPATVIVAWEPLAWPMTPGSRLATPMKLATNTDFGL